MSDEEIFKMKMLLHFIMKGLEAENKEYAQFMADSIRQRKTVGDKVREEYYKSMTVNRLKQKEENNCYCNLSWKSIESIIDLEVVELFKTGEIDKSEKLKKYKSYIKTALKMAGYNIE